MRKEYDFTNAKRGPVVAPTPGKTRITIRIDEDVIDWFRDQVNASGGGNYQTLMNQVLRNAMQENKRPLEAVLRKVVREELKRAASK